MVSVSGERNAPTRRCIVTLLLVANYDEILEASTVRTSERKDVKQGLFFLSRDRACVLSVVFRESISTQ